MVTIQNVNADSLELLMGSLLAVLIVGTVVFSFAAALTFLVFREKKVAAGTPQRVISSVATDRKTAEREPAIAG